MTDFPATAYDAWKTTEPDRDDDPDYGDWVESDPDDTPDSDPHDE